MRLIISFVFFILAAIPAQAEPYFSPEEAPEVADVSIKTVASGLDHPWGMTWLPDGGLLITERTGRVWLFENDQLTEIMGTPSVLVLGQGGLLDISLHPQFADNRLVYFTIATGSESSNRTALVRAEYDGKRFLNHQELFKNNQDKSGGQHFGSRMVWLPDGTLVMTIGDGGNPPKRVNGVLSREMAQNLANHLGKIVRLNDDGSPANPPAFPQSGSAPGLHSIGHRNIQGMAYDPIRDVVWVSEHGARTGDEINRIEAGENYGWPTVSYSKEYTSFFDVAEHKSLPGMTDPVVVWKWRFAPSGLAVYTGDVFTHWKGDLLAGGLRSETIRLIELDEAGKVLGDKNIPMPGRVRDIRQGPDGLVYVLTDEDDGKLLRLEPK